VLRAGEIPPAEAGVRPNTQGQGGGTGNAVLPNASVRIDAGAGYVLPLSGDGVTMPALPREPTAYRIDPSVDGEVPGL
jgi:formyltetrahydrofolate synthetase